MARAGMTECELCRKFFRTGGGYFLIMARLCAYTRKNHRAADR